MRKLDVFTSVFIFSFLLSLPLLAQKQVDEVVEFYQLEAYHLTINKIQELKPKYKIRKDVRLMLADAYWQVGEQNRSSQLYQTIGSLSDIPNSYKQKYLEAVAVSTVESLPTPAVEEVTANTQISTEEFEMPGNSSVKKTTIKTAAKVHQTEASSVPVDLAVDDSTVEEMVENEEPVSTVAVETAPTSDHTVPSIEVPIDKYDELLSEKKITSVKMPAPATSGDFRIRVGASEDLGEFNLPQLESLGPVEIIEWANKKIVFTGFYPSAAQAQAAIDQYLQADYENAVVVTKIDGRYKQVK